jgi:FAD/FMN-containing dehydrogenase
MDELARGIDIYREFAETAVSYGGTVSAEHGVGKIKAKFLNIMYTPDQIQQMKNMKEAFDPDGLLNPGNIFTMEQ